MNPRNYSNKDYLIRAAQTLRPALGFRERGQNAWAIWRTELRAKLIELFGGFPSKAPLEAEVLSTTEEEGYTREHLAFQSEEGVWVPAYGLIPKGLGGPAPAVLCLHGHGGPGGKDYPAGVAHDADAREAIRRYHYDYAVQLARLGYVALVPDARGFGERRAGSENGCYTSGIVAQFLGRTLAGMRAFDDMRAVDYLAYRPEVDPARIGCVGLSEGGKRTLYLSALDDRIGAAVVSGYFTTLRIEIVRWDRLQGWDVCNHVPGLLRWADLPDVAALIAPRPLLIENGRADSLYDPEGVLRGFEIVQEAYAHLGVSDRVALDFFEGEHVFHGEQALPWFDRWLRGGVER